VEEVLVGIALGIFLLVGGCLQVYLEWAYWRKWQ